MFATGSHDGAVRIWTTPKPSVEGPVDDNNSRTESRMISRTRRLWSWMSIVPIAQLDFERQLKPGSPQFENTLQRERKTQVVFADPETVGYTCRRDPLHFFIFHFL
jgi:hypothetical protein